MAVLRLHKALEETGAGESTFAIECGCISAEETEDGSPNFSLPQLPAPEAIAASDLAAKLAATEAAISTVQKLLGKVKISHDDLCRTLDDVKRELDAVKRDRDEWRARAEKLTERPWWRRLAG